MTSLKGIFSIFTLILMGAPALSAPQKKALTTDAYVKYLHQHSAFVARAETKPPFAKAAQEAALLIAQDKKRKPAGLIKPSDELNKLTEAFIAAKTPEKMHELLVTANNNYANYKNTDTKFFVALTTPMLTLRGIVWRFYDVAEQVSLARSFAITGLKQVSSGLHLFLPTENFRAGFRYLTEPYAVDGKIASKFANEAEIQAFMATDVYMALLQLKTRLIELDLKDGVTVDQKVVMGPDSFKDGVGQYKVANNLEKNILLAGIESSMASIAANRAFNNNDAIRLINAMSARQGIGAFLSWETSGIPMKQRVEIIRKYPELGTLVPKDGSFYLGLSHQHVVWSVYYLDQAWRTLKARGTQTGENDYLVDISFANGTEMSDRRMKDLVSLVSEDKTEIRSPVTGKTVVVSIKGYFFPPKDFKNFNAYYPTSFDNSEEWINAYVDPVTKKTFSGKSASYRNYDAGRPLTWSVENYKRIFPNIKDSADLESSLQTLAQSMGGGFALIPIAGYLN